MKKGIKNKILIAGASSTVICGLIGFNVFSKVTTQSGSNTLVGNSHEIMPLYTITGRAELTNQSIKKEIASLVSSKFGPKQSDYVGMENVDSPVRIFLMMEFNPKIESGKTGTEINSTVNSESLAQKVPKSANHLAVFRINNGNITFEYDRDLTDTDFSGDYISTSSKIYFTTEYEISASDSYVAVYFNANTGYIGYNLGIKDDNGRIDFSDSNLYYYTTSGKGSKMYVDPTKAYLSNEPYTITNVEPEDTMGEYTFLAWMDKEQTKDDKITYDARLLDKTTSNGYYFNRSAGTIQTLDAIWAYFKIDNAISEYYNGKSHEQEADFEFTYNLDDKYLTQLDQLGITEEGTTTAWYNDDKQLTSAPIDAGNYKEKFSKNILLQTADNSQITRTVSGDATVTIKKRNVEISSESLVKVYDGTPLVNDGIDGADTGSMMDEDVLPAEDDGKGWVIGEGIDTDTIKFTGSQTEIGKSSNTFTYEGNEQTNLSNYKITKSFGTLEVKPRYQVEYYYDNVKADDETILYEMKSDDVYYEVGDVVNLLDDEAPSTKQYNEIDYKLSNVENKELTLTTVDENNVIKVYYSSKNESNPFTFDNISKFIGTFFISLIVIGGIVLTKKHSTKKEQ